MYRFYPSDTTHNRSSYIGKVALNNQRERRTSTVIILPLERVFWSSVFPAAFLGRFHESI